MRCLYCSADIPPDNKNAFAYEAMAICGRDCWEALGIRLHRMYWKLPYDPDQLNLGVATDEQIAGHDDYWNVPRGG